MKLTVKIHTKILAFISLLFIIVACKNATLPHYDRSANIYFDISQAQRDSILYTFAYDISKSVDTVFVPVKILGYRADNNRNYQAYVQQDSSTAILGEHFKALEDHYVLAANSGIDSLPLVIYNTADLEEKSVSLIVKLKASDDFGIENPNLVRARLVFSAQLEQPVWWSMWLGDYSRTKHRLFLITTEQTTLTMDGLDAPKNLYFADLLRMMLNNPFKWVQDNPEKGYILEPIDTEDSYRFYHIDNPNRPLILKRNPSSGQYFFIDENNLEVR